MKKQMFRMICKSVIVRRTSCLLVFQIVRQHNKTLIGLDKPRKKRYDIFLSRAYTPAKLEQKLLFAAVKLSGSQSQRRYTCPMVMTNEQHKACFGEPGMKDRYAFVCYFYDPISNLYSGKSILRCKVAGE